MDIDTRFIVRATTRGLQKHNFATYCVSLACNHKPDNILSCNRVTVLNKPSFFYSVTILSVVIILVPTDALAQNRPFESSTSHTVQLDARLLSSELEQKSIKNRRSFTTVFGGGASITASFFQKPCMPKAPSVVGVGEFSAISMRRPVQDTDLQETLHPPTSFEYRNDEPWLAFDKVQHVTFGFLWTLGSQYVLVNKASFTEGRALPLSVGASSIVGLSKELYDWKWGPTRQFSQRDLFADAAGILLAVGLILL